ncbi:MAG: dioxygenase, partial [Dehalococcoidia bacterium]
MRDLSEERLAEAFVERLDAVPDERARRVLAALVRHLHAFAREVELTEEEWMLGIRFLTRAGQISDDTRQEVILLSDVLGLSALVDAMNHRVPEGATESTVLGPFFVEGAPELPNGADLTEGGDTSTAPGEPTWVNGRVLTLDGRPV